MKWERGVQNEHVVDIRGRKAPVAKLAGAGGAVAILAVIVSRLLGVDVTGLVGRRDLPPSAGSQAAASLDGHDTDAELVEYIKFAMKDIQDSFASVFQAERRHYTYATLYIFTDAVDTGCGRASAAVGPFYCPADSNAYIDLSFYRDLKARFGAPGDFAEAYVLAHEIGHHIQNLARAEGREPPPIPGETENSHSVRIELQADCYAGVWANRAQGKHLLEYGDLEEAITAARAIGDDRLQQQAGMDVRPESFTHGTSAQRVHWFRRGFQTARLSECNTFEGPI